MDCSPPGSSVHGIPQARILEWVAIQSPGDLPNPGIEPRSPALQADSLLSEPPGKLFILERVAMPSSRGYSQPRDWTQISHMHCMWILYYLSHKGSPRILEWVVYPFSRATSQTRNWTLVSCIAGFFTSWATQETPKDEHKVIFFLLFLFCSKIIKNFQTLF